MPIHAALRSPDIFTELVELIANLGADGSADLERDFKRCQINIAYYLDYTCALVEDERTKYDMRELVDASVASARLILRAPARRPHPMLHLRSPGDGARLELFGAVAALQRISEPG